MDHTLASPQPDAVGFWAQAEEAESEALQMVEVYRDFAVNVAAIPVVAGRKSRIESFAGANTTYTIEGMMGDCRALQVLLLSAIVYCSASSCKLVQTMSAPEAKAADELVRAANRAVWLS